MFFVLLHADRYTGILEANGGFEIFPINGTPQLPRFPGILFAGAGMRGGVLLRTRANSSKPAMIAAAPAMSTSVVFGGIKPRINFKRPRASRNKP